MAVTGIAFPFRFSNTGGVAKSEAGIANLDHIIEAIAQLLTTQTDERVHEAYGSELYKVAFSNGDETDLAEACLYVREAIVQHEPRVTILDVGAEYNKDSDAILINLELQYNKTSEIYEVSYTLDSNGGLVWTN